MQCNQAFCGNPFANGPFCNSYNAPLQPNQSMYPEIVGEGQVTSITLPDGSVQFFFMPTLQWRSANATQCHPFANTPNPMFANNNYNVPPQYNNNGGCWFIRSILPCPQNVFIPPNPRNEFPRLGNTDFCHNLNSLNFGHQVKFHNDAWSSTTDLVYFYPNLRQRDFLYTLPCKDKTVQMDTRPTACVCHFEVVCSKPCHCACSVPAPAAPMSLECLVDPKSTPNNNNISTVDCRGSKQSNKTGKDKKKNIMWACDLKPNIDSVDKPITTYADEGCDCTPAGGRETQTQPMNKDLIKPMWTAKSYSGDSTSECSCADITKNTKISQYNAEDKKALLKTRWPAKSFSGDSMSVVCSCDDVNKKSNNRSEKPLNKSPLKSKRTVKSFSGDSMSVECSCDDLGKKGNNRSEAKPRRKSGQSTSAECACDDISNKPNIISEDCANANAIHEALHWITKSLSGDSMSVECPCDELSNKPTNRSEDNTEANLKALLMPKWTAKSSQSASVECSCDDISKKVNNRSEDNADAEPIHKALLMPKCTSKSKSGQSTSVECSCDDIIKKANNRSEDNADAKPMHEALLMPKWTAKSFSGDSMTDECSCDDASKKPNRRVNEKKYYRCKQKKCDCGCDSNSSVTDKGALPHHGHRIVGINFSIYLMLISCVAFVNVRLSSDGLQSTAMQFNIINDCVRLKEVERTTAATSFSHDINFTRSATVV